jgi:hypothetical protein
MSFAFKMSPLFHFDLVPFGHKPTGSRPSGQTLAGLGKGGVPMEAQEACWGQRSYKVLATCQLPPVQLSLPRRAVLPVTKALSAVPCFTHCITPRVEGRSFRGSN